MEKRISKRTKIKYKWASLFTIFLVIGLSLFSLLVLSVIIWGLSSSLKTVDDFMDNPIWFPKVKWAFSNYTYVLTHFSVPITTTSGTKYVWLEEMILNSILFAVVGAFIQSLSVCWVAYLTQRFNYKFSSIVYVVVLIVMIVPSLNSQASILKISRILGVYDTMFSFYLMKLSFTNMFYLVFFAAYKTFPKDYEESARMDGASELSIFTRIMFPLVSGTFLTIFILNFMAYWNDYMTPLIFMPSKYTVAYGVFYLVNSNVQGLSRVPMKLAICFCFSLPVLILFVLFRDRIMNSIKIGGLKE